MDTDNNTAWPSKTHISDFSFLEFNITPKLSLFYTAIFSPATLEFLPGDDTRINPRMILFFGGRKTHSLHLVGERLVVFVTQ